MLTMLMLIWLGRVLWWNSLKSYIYIYRGGGLKVKSKSWLYLDWFLKSCHKSHHNQLILNLVNPWQLDSITHRKLDQNNKRTLTKYPQVPIKLNIQLVLGKLPSKKIIIRLLNFIQTPIYAQESRYNNQNKDMIVIQKYW